MGKFNYINCLKPLLRILDWQGASRRVFEAVPHESGELDLIDLKNIFVSLGYTSYSKTIQLSKLSRSFLPTLFINESQNIFWVIYERTEKDFLYIDCQTGDKAAISVKKRVKGIRYNFMKSMEDPKPKQTWFACLINRFSQELWQLMLAGLCISLSAVIFPLFVQHAYNAIMPGHSETTLFYFAGGMVGLLFILLIFSQVKNKALAYLAARLGVLIHIDVLTQILKMSPLHVTEMASHLHLSNLRRYHHLKNEFSGAMAFGLFNLISLFLSLGVLFYISGKLALVSLVVLMLHGAGGYISYSRLRELTDKVNSAQDCADDFAHNSLMSRDSIQNLAATQTWMNRYQVKLIQALSFDRLKSSFQSRLFDLSAMTCKGGATLTLIWGMFNLIDGHLTAGALVAIVAVLWQIYASSQTIMNSFYRWPHLAKAIQGLNQLMAIPIESSSSKGGILDLKGHLCVSDVDFQYPDQNRMALETINMEANPGEIVAVMGQNASGKSTFVRVLMRLHDPVRGEIRMDGININDLDPQAYRQSIGYAPSLPQFFTGTIAQNMRLSQPEVSDQEIQRVFEKVGLMEEIQELPKGIHTWLTDQMYHHYSTGFIQKMNLARALIRNSNILIFDEPVGDIDVRSDAIFKETLKELKGKKTIIIVTHRPSIISLADRILVLNNGIMRLFGPKEKVLNILSGNAA